MPRIRTIKPQLFLHGELFDAEKESKLPLRLCFMGLFCQADREGRFKWSARLLKTQIDPYEEKIDFENVLNSLRKYKFIEKYKIREKEYGWIPSWSEHQRPHHTESASILPSCKSEVVQPLNNGESTVTSPSGKEKGKDTGEGKGKDTGRRENTILFLDCIWLTEKEHQELKVKYGSDFLESTKEALSNYQGTATAKFNKYVDHCKVLKSWMNAELKDQKGKKQGHLMKAQAQKIVNTQRKELEVI